MVKKLIAVSLAVVLLCGSLAIGGARRIDEIAKGTITVTLSNADSTGTITANIRKPIVSVDRDEKYDIILASFYLSAFTDPAGVASGGAVDTFWVEGYTYKDYWRQSIFGDTGTGLPCSLNVVYYEDIEADGDTSGGGVWLYGTKRFPGLFLDMLEFDYHCSDSDGTGDTLTATMTYWIRGIENKEE